MSETTIEKTSGTTSGTSDETTPKSKRLRNRNYETRVGQSEELLQVLQVENAEKLTSFGITPEALKEFASMIEKLKATAIKQDEAKASLKTLSARLRTELEQMERRFASFKRKIKAEVPLEEWKRFGFNDKQ
jgi:predicted  nucleic acid-binding Zn-ribbon protein